MIDAKSDNEFLVSLLNSKLGNFFFKSIFVVKSGGFFEIQPDGLGKFPIAPANLEKKSEVSELACSVQAAVEKRLMLQNALTRRIPDLCSPNCEPKLTNKLKEWWTLPNFTAFRAEVKKTFKIDIPLAERSDWEDWINRDRAEIARLTSEIARTEAQIDTIVYDLFELTPDEITLLDSVV